ncbi:hypothetical protein ABTY59_36060 [Streptomyces sp. NPDC096079]|uniref:hypothetical protein n=1 Tax=Streptomyces sp. NPDC096079 TaxID=3155820 RepID=UPI003332464F
MLFPVTLFSSDREARHFRHPSVIEKITSLTSRIDRILGDRPFAEVGDPVLTVADERRGLLTGRYDGGCFFEGELRAPCTTATRSSYGVR